MANELSDVMTSSLEVPSAQLIDERLALCQRRRLPDSVRNVECLFNYQQSIRHIKS
jgi:hypothetical protein